jgi:6-phosphogluconolactonase (cycloisomerase 2 family)
MKRSSLILLILTVILAACQQSDSALALPSEVATLTHPAASPSGQYRLALVDGEKDGGRVLSFQIQDTSGKLIFAPPDQFSTRGKTYFLWDSQDRVWVYAGQTGTFFWQKENSMWVKYDLANSSVSVPPFLEQAQPVQH